MSLYLLVALFIFGLSVGSFLNVVVNRFEPSSFVFNLEKLSGRSRCPHCGKKLKWFELIPLLSFLVQGGKCRGCSKKLSIEYPLVEMASGLILAGVPFFLYNFYDVSSLPVNINYFSVLAALWILVFLTLLLISEIDRKFYLIPNELNLSLAGLGLFVIVFKSLISKSVLPFHNSFLEHYSLLVSPFRSVWINHIFGAVIGALFFLFLIWVSSGKATGWGDVKFAFAGGLAFGWPDIGFSLALAFIIGGIVGAFYLWTGEKSMKGKLPFAPFLVIGFVLTFFFGFDILHNYLLLLGL
ncbi:MAG: A24 family peptidase [Candidatus Magasanikbacteria bacterium]